MESVKLEEKWEIRPPYLERKIIMLIFNNNKFDLILEYTVI